jgi:hypothetical protein
MQSTAQTVGQRQIHDPSSSGAKETLAAQVPHVAGASVWGAHSCQPPLILILIFIFVILNLAEKSVRACPERSRRESASDFGWRSAFSAAINEWEGHDFSRAVKRPWMEGFSPCGRVPRDHSALSAAATTTPHRGRAALQRRVQMRVPMGGGAPELILSIPEWSGSTCVGPPSNLCALIEPTNDLRHVIVTAFDPLKGRGSESVRFDLDSSWQQDRWPLFDISPDGSRFVFSPSTHGPHRDSLQG